MNDKFNSITSKKLYSQAGSGVAIYIIAAAYSGFRMVEQLGYRYQEYYFQTKNGYVEMHYIEDDLIKVWQIIKQKILNNSDYIINIKNKYEEIFSRHKKFFQQIDNTDFSLLTNETLEEYVNKIEIAQSDSVGLAHIIESISFKGESEFRQSLEQEIQNGSQMNEYFLKLTSPNQYSFIAQEEDELRKIAALSPEKQEIELQKHLKKYFWIQNSYFGPQEIDLDFFRKRMAQINYLKKEQIVSDEEKIQLTKELNISQKTKQLADILALSTVWRDERKANILKTIHYFSKINTEIARRLNVDVKLVEHMTLHELRQFSSLDKKGLKEKLVERYDGSYYYLNGTDELVISGPEYRKICSQMENKSNHKITDEIRGMIANGGSVIGRAVICKGISEFSKVQDGDILVTSMTRPEFMPILRKVAAIVTDEGGITCHAAIVARELNIPAVIGTKVATKIIKDGMMVEVKANHGLVKILVS